MKILIQDDKVEMQIIEWNPLTEKLFQIYAEYRNNGHKETLSPAAESFEPKSVELIPVETEQVVKSVPKRKNYHKPKKINQGRKISKAHQYRVTIWGKEVTYLKKRMKGHKTVSRHQICQWLRELFNEQGRVMSENTLKGYAYGYSCYLLDRGVFKELSPFVYKVIHPASKVVSSVKPEILVKHDVVPEFHSQTTDTIKKSVIPKGAKTHSKTNHDWYVKNKRICPYCEAGSVVVPDKEMLEQCKPQP